MAATHMYVVLQGDYTAAGLAGEIWQTGCRFGASPGAAEPNALGAFAPFDVVALPQTVTQPTYTIVSNWTTEMGISDLDPVSWLEDQIRPAAATLIANAFFGAGVRLRSILVYPIRQPDGKVEPAVPFVQGSPCRLDYTSGFPTGSGTGLVPPQLSVVASLRTSQLGRRGRGRMFLPPAGTSSIANGRLSSAFQGQYGTDVKAFLEGCRLAGTGPGGVWTYPVVTGAPYTDYATVNQVRIGDVFDTQRRRRATLLEAYANTTIDPFA